MLDEIERAKAAETEAEKQAAEEEERQRQQEEAERAAEVQRQREERERLEKIAGLSPEDLRRAEELANWEFVKGRSDVEELRDHLARFEGGNTEPYARTALEEAVWADLPWTPSAEDLEAFLDEFPEGPNAAVARRRLATLSAPPVRKRVMQAVGVAPAGDEASGKSVAAEGACGVGRSRVAGGCLAGRCAVGRRQQRHADGFRRSWHHHGAGARAAPEKVALLAEQKRAEGAAAAKLRAEAEAEARRQAEQRDRQARLAVEEAVRKKAEKQALVRKHCS